MHAGVEGLPREARGYDGGDEPHGRDDGVGGEVGEAGVETPAADMQMADADETPLMNPDVNAWAWTATGRAAPSRMRAP